MAYVFGVPSGNEIVAKSYLFHFGLRQFFSQFTHCVLMFTFAETFASLFLLFDSQRNEGKILEPTVEFK